MVLRFGINIQLSSYPSLSEPNTFDNALLHLYYLRPRCSLSLASSLALLFLRQTPSWCVFKSKRLHLTRSDVLSLLLQVSRQAILLPHAILTTNARSFNPLGTPLMRGYGDNPNAYYGPILYLCDRDNYQICFDLNIEADGGCVNMAQVGLDNWVHSFQSLRSNVACSLYLYVLPRLELSLVNTSPCLHFPCVNILHILTDALCSTGITTARAQGT